jgi:hypothetical protein
MCKAVLVSVLNWERGQMHIPAALRLTEWQTVRELDVGVVAKERKMLFRRKSRPSRSTHNQSLYFAISFRKW